MPAAAAALPGLIAPTTLVLRHAEHREEGREDEDREQEIGGRPGEHDEEALPHRAQLEGAVAQLRRECASSSAGLLAGFMSPTNLT